MTGVLLAKLNVLSLIGQGRKATGCKGYSQQPAGSRQDATYNPQQTTYDSVNLEE
jgi:hypothetical protein